MSAPRNRWLYGFSFISWGSALRLALAVAMLAGIASLFFSEIDGWDQRNYHLYNGWAIWNNRIGVDLAPAQMQSYFVPWMDALYWALLEASPVLMGFALGFWHGTAFALVGAIAWLVLADDVRRPWLAPAFALAGTLSSVFLFELGGTHGDNTTAPLVLGAVWCVLFADRSGKFRFVVLAGVMLGLATALKMSNSIYAVGLGLATLCGRHDLRWRMRSAALLAAVTLAAFAITAGPWLWMVWKQFGNPIFPKFNTFFGSSLAGAEPAVTTRKLPKSWGEALFFPLLMSVDPRRVNGMFQLTWALAWMSCALALLGGGLRRVGKGWTVSVTGPIDFATRMLWMIVGATFVVWMARFSVHRYLGVAEMLAPLALWLLVRRIAPKRIAEWAAGGVATACALAALAGWKLPENSGWLHAPIIVDVPELERPQTATVLLAGRGPQAWRIPFLPAGPVYVGLGGNFATSPQYISRVHEIASGRGGQVHAMFPAATNKHLARAEKFNRDARTVDGIACEELREHARGDKHLSYVGPSPTVPCRIQIARAEREFMTRFNRSRQQSMAALLREAGWELQLESCVVMQSHIGDMQYPYYWCRLSRP